MDLSGGNFNRRVNLPPANFQNMINSSPGPAWPVHYNHQAPTDRHRTPSGSSSCDSTDSTAFGRQYFDPYSVVSVSYNFQNAPTWNAAVGCQRKKDTLSTLWEGGPVHLSPTPDLPMINDEFALKIQELPSAEEGAELTWAPDEIKNLIQHWEVPPYETDMTSCVGNGSIINNGRMDKFVTNMLQGTTLSPFEGQHHNLPKKCTGCNLYKAAGRCQDCVEILCRQCVFAHMRSRLTKDHFIVQLVDENPNAIVPLSNFPSTSSSPNSLHLPPMSPHHCDLHHSEVNLFCQTCGKPGCKECMQRNHRSHTVIYLHEIIEETKARNARMLAEAQSGIRAMEAGIDKVQEMTKKVEKKFVEVQKEVTGTARRYMLAIEERERFLLTQLERVRQMKGKSLMMQMESLKNLRQRLSGCVEMLSKDLDKASAISLLKIADQVSTELRQIRSLHTSLCPCEDDLFTFVQPDQMVFRAMQNFGIVRSSGYANATEIQGKIPRTAPTGKVSGFIVRVRNHLKEIQGFGHEMLSSLLIQPDGVTVITPDISDQGDGLYKISFCPQVEGDHTLHVRLRGKSIPHSPFKIKVRACRSYANLGTPLLCFGSEGEGDGLLCRPWGICCNKEGELIVADRSNNRVQVFDSNGNFLFKFGSQGSNPGQFDRPAGITTDVESNIIVADKDNHRIQIFSKTGKHFFMFGEKGTKPGQFNYPWDVAVNGSGDIIVSDTRNHRIQLFRGDGTFVTKYGFEGTSSMWKHFDSPRGVSFTPDGSIIVTDFNNHRVVVIEANFSNARFLGCEGAGPKQFLRPQGVVVDADGYIIVADSRNHRIQIFDTDGSMVAHFGSPGKNIGEFDRPSGICVTPDGKIVVVDFGNNRVQVF